MKPTSPEQAVFAEALQRATPEARAAYLDGACGADVALRRRVEALLHAAESAGDFLEQPPTGLTAGDRSTMVVTLSSEKTGDRIGRYKLLQQIGEGGCGVVYMAEQEEPVRRRVALKVIKLGMDTKSVIARFEAERQALALMDHPNIAKVLDAGATEMGRPYFVMELVRGIKITDYCDQGNLPTEERLKLFTQVCQAIQHAHQKGIIHRDIKPSNILIADHDGVPVPKVIDFGIAKATTGQRLTDKTVFTAFEQFIGTPAYMSPEQANLSGLDIDTRTDIYALGVLLYELLTGQTPFDAKELMAAGLDAMRRIIRDQEPARPSTRLSTLLAADLTTVASHRHAEPARLGTLLRGDLDWIVMKALEKDRTRRYETANGLAMDIQRHLDDEPIVARPASNLYRFQKMVRRNKLAFTAASAITVALVVGLGVSTWMFFKEKQALQRAVIAEYNSRTEAAKSQQVAQFMKDMLKGVGPSVALGRDTTMLREILDRTAERIGRDLNNQPEVEVELRAILALTYEELALFKQREEMAREALRVSRARLGEEHPAVADALHQIGDARSRLGDQVQAEKFMREAVALKRKVLGNEHPSTAASLNVLAWVFKRQNKLTEAEVLGREALAIRIKLFGNEHPAVADSLFLLGNVLSIQGRQTEAETAHGEALAIYRKVLGDEHPAVAESLNNLAVVLRRAGKLAEAETMLREALTRRRRLFSPGHPEVAESYRDLVLVLRDQGKLDEVETLYREELALQRKSVGNEHPEVAAPRP
ncbi:MAG: serine/threonine protein kinase [Verrucomicrobia bacterium]|nr:serine/threonine protein kinase [Verrucomicrobiota bacterium]